VKKSEATAGKGSRGWRAWCQRGAGSVGGVVGRPEGGRGDEVVFFVIKTGANLLQRQAAGGVHALGDVSGGEDKAGELHALQRGEVGNGRLSNVKTLESRAGEGGEVFDFGFVEGEADERGLGECADVFDRAASQPKHAQVFAGGEGADVGDVGVDDVQLDEWGIFQCGEIAGGSAAEVKFFQGHAAQGREICGDGVFQVEFDDFFALEGAEVGDGRLAEVEGDGVELFDKAEVLDLRGAEVEGKRFAFLDLKLAVPDVGGVVILDLGVKHLIRPVEPLWCGRRGRLGCRSWQLLRRFRGAAASRGENEDGHGAQDALKKRKHDVRNAGGLERAQVKRQTEKREKAQRGPRRSALIDRNDR